MILYKCRVSDSSGKISEILKSAGSEEALIKAINDQSLFLISFSEVKKRAKKNFSKKVILDFTDTMALMLKSGLSVHDALKVSEGELVETLALSLTRGKSFPEAVNELQSDFSPLYRGMVKIGDSTGSMDDIFQKLSAYLNEDKKMREKIQGALMYPALVLSVLFMGLAAVFLFIFPRIKKTFVVDSLDQVFSRFQFLMIIMFVPVILLILFIFFLFIASRSRGKSKKLADKILLKTPLIGKIGLLQASLNIMFSLEVLTNSGYPLESALKESSAVLSNSQLRDALNRIRKAIIRGDKLSASFKKESVFPHRIPVWVSVGEASGDVSPVFAQLRTYFQGELDRLTSGIMLLIEPVLIVLVGFIMILFIVLFVVPLFGVFGAVL